MEDRTMTDLIYERNEAGLNAAAESFGALCRRIARNLLASDEDAEECVNDALLAVWNSIPPQKPQSLSAYICRITRNIAINRRRAAERQKRGGGEAYISLSELEECLPDRLCTTADERSDAEAITAVIDTWLDTLPRRTRLLFVGRYFEGRDIRSLARDLAMGEGAARSALHRARLDLRRALTAAGVEL